MPKTTTEILVGIPRANYDPGFQDSLSSLTASVPENYVLTVYEIYDRQRDEAREAIVEYFLTKTQAPYLLFLDDDHTGHTWSMVQSLLDKDAYFSSINCFARYFPYQFTVSALDPAYHDHYGPDNLNTKRGWSKCRFAGFGMALIRRDLFDHIEPPYFKCDSRGEREDNYFCEKILNAGLDIWGCFDHNLPHAGITQQNVLEKRRTGFRDYVVRHNRRFLLNNYIRRMKQTGKKLTEEQTFSLATLQILVNPDESDTLSNVENLYFEPKTEDTRCQNTSPTAVTGQ